MSMLETPRKNRNVPLYEHSWRFFFHLCNTHLYIVTLHQPHMNTQKNECLRYIFILFCFYFRHTQQTGTWNRWTSNRRCGLKPCQCWNHHCALSSIHCGISVGMHCDAVAQPQLHSSVKWKVSHSGIHIYIVVAVWVAPVGSRNYRIEMLHTIATIIDPPF